MSRERGLPMERTECWIRVLLVIQGLLGLAMLLVFIGQSEQGVLLVVILVVLMMVAQAVTFSRIKREINKTLGHVDDTINELIAGGRSQYFSANEDSLLGKFQTQIAALYELLKADQKREQAFRNQTEQSVSNLVHQLNTPITNISLYSDFLLEDDLPADKRKQFAQSIGSQADKLSFLGEGFAKVSRLEAGIITLAPQQQPVLPVVLAAIDELTAKASAHGNEIVLLGDQGLSAQLDAKWTREALLNVLDNAVKYSYRDTAIVVELLAYELFIRINVINDGLPIVSEERAQVFQRFYRAETVKELPGVGLGLYLTREILKGQGGYIKASETNDGQTMFSLYLLK